ncbi:MAG: hypothetical protein NZ484_00915 [Patescibacteria group bacterium]|nr:hypothetical protein [Patescibacteria group bacterium]MDW8279733.1 hypothetical protein [bacterium]
MQPQINLMNILNFIKNNIFKSKLNLFLFIIFFSILGLIFIFQFDYYPVLFINNNIIVAKKVNLNINAALNFYNAYKKIQENQINNDIKLNNLSYNNVKVIVLNELIDRTLIHDELKKRLGDNLNNLVNDKINIFLDKEVENAAFTIYNLNKKDFINEILIPQAEKDILIGRLFLENKNIDDWLKDAKINSKIIILDKRFLWNGQEIILNK